MKTVLPFVVTLAALTSCADDAPGGASAGNEGSRDDGTGAVRDIRASVTFDERGLSSPVAFTVPHGTRSIAVVVEGEPARLHALGAFAMGDGIERVGIDVSADLASEMQRIYFTEQTGAMPGGLHQSIRLGTFTHVYPFAPDQSVAPGAAELRVVRDAPGGAATVRVIMPPDDGANVIHLNLVRVSASEEMPAQPTFVSGLRRIFGEAGIDVVIDEAQTLRGTGLEKLTSFTEPQEAPDSDSAALARLVGPKTRSTALDVMIVDDLPSGVGGLSLGVPGPPVAESYYYGVVVAAGSDVSMARVIAHETAHFLGLQHVENRGVSGQIYEDPIADTSIDRPNLMTKGTAITPGQAFVLSRSPLLALQ